MKTQTRFENASLVSVVNGSIVVKDFTGREHTFTNASVVSVNNGTIIIESEWEPKVGELIKFTWDGFVKYGIFKEISSDKITFWTYGCSINNLSEFPYDGNNPRYQHYRDCSNILPVTPEEQKEFDDFCKSQGKIWNKEKLQWEKYRWKPLRGENYFYIALTAAGIGISSFKCREDSVDQQAYEVHNCFKTEEEAKAKLEQIKKLLLEV